MEGKKFLTNEKISKKFNSQFELVNYAIKLAENMILSGREGRVRTDSQNHALQVIAEIIYNKDQFEELPMDSMPFEETNSFVAKDSEEKKSFSAAASDRKKTRKMSSR